MLSQASRHPRYRLGHLRTFPRLKALIARGPVVVFAVDHDLDRSFFAALQCLDPAPRLVRFRPGQRLVDQALELLQ